MDDGTFDAMRRQMLVEVADHARFVAEFTGRDALDGRVLAAMDRVPRHEFVPAEVRAYAYLNMPVPIGHGKTVSQPFIVALMLDLLEISAGDTVLEVGAGLGYQAAVLSELAARVYTVEIIDDLAREAARRLKGSGYTDVAIKIGDGSRGWAEHAPFDKIVVAAAAELIPPRLMRQLKPGGRMIVPAGLEDAQSLILVRCSDSGRYETEEVLPVRFGRLIQPS